MRLTLALLFHMVLLAPATAAIGTTVRMQTSLGNIDIQLMDAEAPATVANFLAYVTGGAYVNSFIHRSVPGFIVQGGGFGWNSASNAYYNIPANPPVVNEFSTSRSNLRGTIAMAKLAGDPNSATNQWFFNLANNAANLDNQNGGFTVFGQVIGNGMQVVDAIAALPIVNVGSPFDNLPLITLPAGTITTQHLVIISAVTVLPSIAIGSPAVTGQTFNTNASALSVSGTASNNVVSVLWTNDRGGSGTASGTTSWSAIAIALQPGTNTITVRAFDSGGNVGVATMVVNYRVAGDFNADAKSDLLLRHTNGTNYIWHIDGASIANSTLAIPSQGYLPGLDASWTIAGVGDFNGDGKSDVLLRQATNGTIYVWHLDGAQINNASISILSHGYLPSLDSNWSIAGVGDFNGDGKSDVLLRHTNGTVYIWHLDGTSIINSTLSIASQGYLPSLDGNWTVAGVADFNGDGKSDLLIRHANGTNYIWHIDGSNITGSVVAIPSHGYVVGLDGGWSIAGVGDFNGDGKADVLLRHANGTNYVWHLDGANIMPSGYISIVSQGYLPGLDGSWMIAGVGDFNGDGKSDVLLRHANGTNYVWHIDGSSIVNQTLGIPSQGYLPSLDAGWSVIMGRGQT